MKIRLMISLVIIAVALGLCPAAFAGKVQLDAGTEIKVQFDPNIKVSSGELVEGVPVLITLAQPITIGGQVIVETGAEGTAVVKKVEKHGMVGKPGYIQIEFVDLGSKGAFTVVDDGRMKLSGMVENRGKGKKLLSIILGFGLIIKGGNGELDTSQSYTATIAENVLLEN